MDTSVLHNPSCGASRTQFCSGRSKSGDIGWADSRTLRGFALLLVLALTVWPCWKVQAEPPLKPVSFMPQWIPQAQFAGYFVAHDKGFYRESGLDVTLLPGGPGKDCFTSIASGQVTFGTGWLSSAIQRRASGVPIVNLAQMMQRSSLLLIAKRSSGIRTAKDLNGKRVGFWVGEFEAPEAVFVKKHHLKFPIIPNYTTVTVLLKGAVDAVAAMWYNEYHLIFNGGFNPDELTLLRFSDLGVDFPEDGLYCSEEAYKADPEACAAFVAASLKGWLYAFEHEDEALNIVMKYARAAYTGTNRAHQRWMLSAVKGLMLGNGGQKEMGKLNRADYEKVGNALKSLSLIRFVPKYKEFYRGRQ
jgi:NitT/TauT family transport system substrate-binding protein